MELDALFGRYNRLKHELDAAYQSLPWPSGRIDRLADDLALTEREIAARHVNPPATAASWQPLAAGTPTAG